MWNLPRPGIEPLSSALAGGFLSTVPPGKSCTSSLSIHLEWTLAAVATAKSLQSCPTLCDPIDGSPPGSPISGILQARTLEWIAISFSNAWKRKVKVKLLCHVQFLATPWTAAYQVPLSMEFSRQEYWSGVPLPSPTVSISWLLSIMLLWSLGCRYLFKFVFLLILFISVESAIKFSHWFLNLVIWVISFFLRQSN